MYIWGQGNLYIMLNCVFWCFRREMLRVLSRPWRNMNPRLPRWSERVEEEFKESRQLIWYLEISVKSQVRSIWISDDESTRLRCNIMVSCPHYCLSSMVDWMTQIEVWASLKCEHLSYKKNFEYESNINIVCCGLLIQIEHLQILNDFWQQILIFHSFLIVMRNAR